MSLSVTGACRYSYASTTSHTISTRLFHDVDSRDDDRSASWRSRLTCRTIFAELWLLAFAHALPWSSPLFRSSDAQGMTRERRSGRFLNLWTSKRTSRY